MWLLLSLLAHADEPREARFAIFHQETSWAGVIEHHFESSYVSHPVGLGETQRHALIFEGNTAPYIPLASWGNAARGNGRFRMFFSPNIRMRMFAEPSAPVWSPSFMPRGVLYYYPERFLPDADRQEIGPFFSVMVSHHSNGQRDCFFLDAADEPVASLPGESVDCPTAGTVNTLTGNFSTNFVRLSATWPAFSVRRLKSADLALVSLAYEVHPDINREDALEGRYGFHRADLRARTYITVPRWLRVRTEAKLVALLDPGLSLSTGERFIFDASTTLLFSQSSRAERVPEYGLFVRYYRGQDYYNTRFMETYSALSVGLLLEMPTVRCSAMEAMWRVC